MGCTYAGRPCIDPRVLMKQCRRHKLPTNAFVGKANSYFTTIGPFPARAYVLMLRGDINALGVNGAQGSSVNDLVFNDNTNSGYGRLVCRDMMMVQEAIQVSPGSKGDPYAVYLVPLADARWAVQNSYYSSPLNKAYNVRAPAGGSNTYYTATTNGGDGVTAWTWGTMLQDLWGGHPLLGASAPSIPPADIPDGTPENFRFHVSSAWDAWNSVLLRAGCALTIDPTASPAGRAGIILIGDDDALLAVAEAKYNRLRWTDDDPIRFDRATIPFSVYVCFQAMYQHYGTEPTTRSDDQQWSISAKLLPLTSPVYYINVSLTSIANAARIYAADPTASESIWDDMAAILDVTGSPTNLGLLQNRALDRAGDFYRMLLVGSTQFPGSPMHRVYRNIIADSAFFPGKQISGYAVYDYGDGFRTEIIRKPYQIRAGDNGRWERVYDQSHDRLRPPDLSRATFPNYPPQFQPVAVTGTTSNPSVFTGQVMQQNPVNFTLATLENCLIYAITGFTTPLTTNHIYPGRLNGTATATATGGPFTGQTVTLPLYQVWGSWVNGGGQCVQGGISLSTY